MSKEVTTGFSELDSILSGGFRSGEVTLICSRPGEGKSAFAMNMAIKAAESGSQVGFAFIEMDRVTAGIRLSAYSTGISVSKLRKDGITDEERDMIKTSLARMLGDKIWFLYDCHDIDEISRLASIDDDYKIDILIIDSFQFIESNGETMPDVGYIAYRLKLLAIKAGIPVVVVYHLPSENSNEMPKVSDEFNAEHDNEMLNAMADNIIFIHNESQDGDVFNSCINVAKQRNGTTGQVRVIFDPKIMRYTQIARVETE